MQRAQVLDAAKKAIADRGLNYGNPEDNFQRIANLWNTHLRNVSDVGEAFFDSGDVAIMLGMVKLARLQNDMRDEDSWIDLAGYAACGAEVSRAGDTPATCDDYSATLSEDIRRECQPFSDERAMGEQLADGAMRWAYRPFVVEIDLDAPMSKFGFTVGEHVSFDRYHARVCGFTATHVIVRWIERPSFTATDTDCISPGNVRHEPELETKFGFRLGETVNIKTSPSGNNPGEVVGFSHLGVGVQWKLGGIHFYTKELLRHGP